MSRIVKFGITFILGFVGASIAPVHACRLNSTPLLVLIGFVCFIVLPLIACRAGRTGPLITVASPFIAFGAMLFYVRILHWEHFPSVLIDDKAASMANQCKSMRYQIEVAKTQWAVQENKTTNDAPTDAEIYGPERYLIRKPECPDGGTYVMGRVGEPVRCSVKEHSSSPLKD